MRIAALLPTVYVASLAASVAASAANAQRPGIVRIAPDGIDAPRVRAFAFDEPRAVIGITTTSSSNSRDTLGVLVASIRSGSPAEKAGIEEGNRIASVNGVSLELSPADVADREMATAMTHRLTRELDKLKPGDEVDLRVVANGQIKSVKVKTISPDDLYDSPARRRDSERATLGVNLAMTGNARDTLGVFVMSVDDGSPAAKAGIEEGSRIASINGVDVRSKRAAEDDDSFFRSTSSVNRLEREVSRVKPGDVVALRVYYNGQYKDVKVTAARMSDVPRARRSITIMGGDNYMPMIQRMPELQRMPERIDIDGVEIGDRVRRALDGAGVAAAGALSGFGFGNSVRW